MKSRKKQEELLNKMRKLIINIIVILIILGISILIIKKYETTKVVESSEELSEKLKYDMREKIPIEEEYMIQATWRSCWTYATLDSIETNIMLNTGKKYNFSESHVEYMTSTLINRFSKNRTGTVVGLIYWNILHKKKDLFFKMNILIEFTKKVNMLF